MFIHYSIILIILKDNNKKVDQDNYNNLFLNIENNLRELGFGDVSVNKKMKELNKLFYDILLKLNKKNENFDLNRSLISKYFNIFKNNDEKWFKCEKYFKNFYKYCFDKTDQNVIEEAINFKL